MHSPSPLHPDSDIDLIRRAQTGDESAFGDLMKIHYGYVYRLVYAVVRHEHDTRDICQEVWLTVWQKLSEYRATGKFTTWLHPIATRRAIDQLRKRRRWYDRFVPFATGDDDLPAFEAIGIDDTREDTEKSELRGRLDDALAALPPLHRAVLTLREIQGLSYDEISQAAGIPAGTVMSRLYHARRLLAKKLKQNP